MRDAKIERKTTETDIALSLGLDENSNENEANGGCGQKCRAIDTGCGFLDHMLTLFAHHGRFELRIRCEGDVDVDYHHTVEDVGIALGDAFAKALGDCAGIRRYGSAIIPMDEALALVAVDVSGRAHLSYETPAMPPKVGDFDTELAEEFWCAFTRRAGVTMHIRLLAGKNAHHMIECVFKAAARALSEAVSIDVRARGEVPSTKGIL